MKSSSSFVLRIRPRRGSRAGKRIPNTVGSARTNRVRRRRKRRLEVVEARDAGAENRARKWYMFRAVEGFNVQGGNRGVKEGWVWDAVRAKVNAKA